MKHFIRLNDFTKEDMKRIFHIADEIPFGNYDDYLKEKTILLFFPQSSIRTRVTFEKGIYLMGGQSILFSPDTLDKKEDMKDVISYLNNWVDGIIIRHKDIALIENMSAFSNVPIINALTDCNHPCEMLADLYALSKIRKDFTKDRFLFVGAASNIGYAWKEASELLGFSFEQCCPPGYEIEGVKASADMTKAFVNKDIICTDSISSNYQVDFKEYQVTLEHMKLANHDALLNPCPPFYRGEEVSSDVIDSSYFVGYDFKSNLLEIQQAILIYCMEAM